VPDLDHILALEHPGFRVEKIDDQGISVSKFDPDSDATLIDSERTWLVSFLGAPGEQEPAATFRFGAAKVDGAELAYQRYVDADLAKVGPEITLESRYEQARHAWLWWLGGSLLGLAIMTVVIRILRSRPTRALARRFEMPELVTPFSVLGLLRAIQHHNGLPAPEMQELAGSIANIERHYFAASDGASIDLKQVAEAWIRRAT
jgi:hypothetical protein